MPGPYFIFGIVYQSVFDSTESNTKWFAEGLPLKAWGLKLSLKVWILKVLNWKIQQSKIQRQLNKNNVYLKLKSFFWSWN